MKLGVVIAALIGLAGATALVAYVGFGGVYRAMSVIGWRGVGFLCLYSIAPLTLLATAWFVLFPGAGPRQWPALMGARAVRDAAGELLPFSHVGGFVVGARAAILTGIPRAIAASTTVADATTEFIAQLGFLGLGLAILAGHLGRAAMGGALLEAGLIGLAVAVLGAAAFVALQRRGMRRLEVLVGRLAPRAAPTVADFGRALNALYDRPLRLVLAVVIHFAAWIVSAMGVWLALRLAGVDIGLAGVLAIESLVWTVRGAAFMAPMGIGVQEAAYAVVGPLFGVGAEMALAISLLRRARDLVVGIPTLLIWQALEGKRLFRAADCRGDLLASPD